MIWKKLKDEHPQNLSNVLILTPGNKIEKAFWSETENKFYRRCGLVKPLTYKFWCYEEDLVNEILESIGSYEKEQAGDSVQA